MGTAVGLAAGVGGTARFGMRKRSGKAVVMPASGKSLAQGCGSASRECRSAVLGREGRRPSEEEETSGVASAKGLTMRTALVVSASGTWTVAK